MNSVGIDISKGRSTVAVMRPFGEVVISPFEVRHTDSELSELARQLKSLDGETRVVMEATGNYHAPVAKLLHDAGPYVSVVNAKLVHGYAGLDAPPNDSGDVTGRHKSMSKVGTSSLRRTLFLVMSVYLQNAPLDEPVYQFMDRKRAEGKPYRVYMMASANKFLRIYYATVKAYLKSLEHTA